MEINAPKDVAHLECNIAKPDYPALSRRRGEAGTALVKFVVGLTGKIENIELKKSSGSSRLDDAALDAMRSSACKPYMENGVADPCRLLPALRIRPERLARPSDRSNDANNTKIRPNFRYTGTAMQNYGLAHVWAQGDFVTRGIALALVIMSVLSWTVIVVKGWNVVRLKRLTKNAEQAFWHSDDFADGIKKLGSRLLERRRTIRSSRSRSPVRTPPITIIRRSRICTTAWTCRTGSRAA